MEKVDKADLASGERPLGTPACPFLRPGDKVLSHSFKQQRTDRKFFNRPWKERSTFASSHSHQQKKLPKWDQIRRIQRWVPHTTKASGVTRRERITVLQGTGSLLQRGGSFSLFTLTQNQKGCYLFSCNFYGLSLQNKHLILISIRKRRQLENNLSPSILHGGSYISQNYTAITGKGIFFSFSNFYRICCISIFFLAVSSHFSL